MGFIRPLIGRGGEMAGIAITENLMYLKPYLGITIISIVIMISNAGSLSVYYCMKGPLT